MALEAFIGLLLLFTFLGSLLGFVIAKWKVNKNIKTS